jgi:Zn finger protein HypA/HybF involved in hydrogenase expression
MSFIGEHWECKDCQKWFKTGYSWKAVVCPFCEGRNIESNFTKICRLMKQQKEREAANSD